MGHQSLKAPYSFQSKSASLKNLADGYWPACIEKKNSESLGQISLHLQSKLRFPNQTFVSRKFKLKTSTPTF
jgi:hypothetical protein